MKYKSKCKICKHTLKKHLFYNGGKCRCCFAGVKFAYTDKQEPLFYTEED